VLAAPEVVTPWANATVDATIPGRSLASAPVSSPRSDTAAPPSVPPKTRFPETEAALHQLTFGARLSIARQAVDDLKTDRLSPAEGFAQALNLIDSIPLDAQEYPQAAELKKQLQPYRPTVDEMIAFAAPEERLDYALYILKEVFDHPSRTDLIDIAEKYVAAIPSDLQIDQNKLSLVRSGIALLRSGKRTAPDLSDNSTQSPPGVCSDCVGAGPPKAVHVRAYTRRDGTQVNEHYRNSPRR